MSGSMLLVGGSIGELDEGTACNSCMWSMYSDENDTNYWGVQRRIQGGFVKSHNGLGMVKWLRRTCIATRVIQRVSLTWLQ